MKVFNGTAHTINIFSVGQCDCSNPRKLIVLDGQEPIYTIAAGTNLNCVKDNKVTPKGDFPFPNHGRPIRY